MINCDNEPIITYFCNLVLEIYNNKIISKYELRFY